MNVHAIFVSDQFSNRKIQGGVNLLIAFGYSTCFDFVISDLRRVFL